MNTRIIFITQNIQANEKEKRRFVVRPTMCAAHDAFPGEIHLIQQMVDYISSYTPT